MEFSPYSTFLPRVLQSQKPRRFHNQTRCQRLSLIVVSSDRSSWRYDAPLLVCRKGSNFFEIFTSVTPKLLHVQCNLITQGNSRQLTQITEHNKQTNATIKKNNATKVSRKPDIKVLLTCNKRTVQCVAHLHCNWSTQKGNNTYHSAPTSQNMLSHLFLYLYSNQPMITHRLESESGVRCMRGPPESPLHGSWYSPLLNSSSVPNIFVCSYAVFETRRLTRLSRSLYRWVQSSWYLKVVNL